MPHRQVSSGCESPTEDLADAASRLRSACISTPASSNGRPAGPASARPVGLDGMVARVRRTRNSHKVGIRGRVGCYQWTWFTMTMVTLPLALGRCLPTADTAVGHGRCLQRPVFRYDSTLSILHRMLTGSSVPYHRQWLTAVGTAFFLFNIALFLANCTLLILRFCLCPGSFVKSFKDQVESLFIASFVSIPNSTDEGVS